MSKIDLTTPKGRAAANEALAKLCGITNLRLSVTGVLVATDDGCVISANFLTGLRHDGTCDEVQVNCELLGRLVLRLKERVWLWWDGCEWVGEATDGKEQATHAHPAVALYLVAEAVGLLDAAPDAEKGKSE